MGLSGVVNLLKMIFKKKKKSNIAIEFRTLKLAQSYYQFISMGSQANLEGPLVLTCVFASFQLLSGVTYYLVHAFFLFVFEALRLCSQCSIIPTFTFLAGGSHPQDAVLFFMNICILRLPFIKVQVGHLAIATKGSHSRRTIDWDRL